MDLLTSYFQVLGRWHWCYSGPNFAALRCGGHKELIFLALKPFLLTYKLKGADSLLTLISLKFTGVLNVKYATYILNSDWTIFSRRHQTGTWRGSSFPKQCVFTHCCSYSGPGSLSKVIILKGEVVEVVFCEVVYFEFCRACFSHQGKFLVCENALGNKPASASGWAENSCVSVSRGNQINWLRLVYLSCLSEDTGDVKPPELLQVVPLGDFWVLKRCGRC